jgi:hypothetical protein
MLQLFHLDVAKVDQGMLYMLQVFRRHVARVCSNYFIYFQTYVAIFLIWMLHMLQQYVHNVSAVLILCCSKWFSCYKLQLFYLGVSCVSHTCCKCMFQTFYLFSDVCCIQMFFHVASVLHCSVRGEWELVDGVRDAPRGQ